MDGVWDRFLFNEPMHGFNGLFGEVAQFLCEHYPSAAFAPGVKDGTPRNIQPEHFFEAQSLRAKLSIVIVEFATSAFFKLDRNQRTIGMTFDNIAPAAETEPIRPDGQSTQQSDAFNVFITRNIGLFVDTIADYGMLIGPSPSLNRLQCRPTLTVEVVIEE